MKDTSFNHRTRFQLAPAFTLIELIVVISIIATLMTIGSFGLKNVTKASGVGMAVPIAEGVFAQARALAMEKGTDARVLIHADNDTVVSLNRERNLRYMVVQYLEDDQGTVDPNDDVWTTASRGITLPDGVFFSSRLSGLGTAPDVNVAPVNPTLPGGVASICRYYQFNSQGIITDPAPNGNDVPRFVIRAGMLAPGQTEATASSSGGEKNAGGFVIWRTGRTSVFRHPDQIDPAL